ncbi:uroporphyrinogen-III C-methyltransferase [Catenovulum sp. 2E275]|uniref:uroporphyrinogen-III C-methyltransferase n=1 Tax=Catenovulum sp. 2E275 TaxID=2980497 RepID=UPI0021D0468A|nr:uroporphyrinogen-III C-methyltransferase [Catenovulum sp. 2E275]MCU4675081.1 uroporphyrinogen-III C-methyltransferase [Catenovulum sp. 2E275]
MTDKADSNNTIEMAANKESDKVSAQPSAHSTSANKESEQTHSSSAKAEPSADKITASKTEKSTPPPINPPKVKTKSNAIAWLALLIALAGLALAGWQYWLTYQKGEQKDLLSEQLKQQQNQFIQSANQQQNTNTQTLKNELNQSLSQFKNQFEQTLNQRQTQLQQSIDNVTASLNKSQSQAALADIHHLIQLASRKLYIEQDKTGAVTVLKLAQADLAQQNNSQWFNLSNQISTDIANIEALKEVDVQTLYLRLTELNQKVIQQPLNQAYIPKATEQSQNQTASSTIGWDNLYIIWREFLDLFLPKQRDGSVEALLSPAQVTNLQQNLTSKFNQAQWALLNKQANVYQTAISQIQTWVAQYYQVDSEQIGQIQQTLDNLKQQDLSQDFSALELNSLSTAKALLQQASQTSSTNDQVAL